MSRPTKTIQGKRCLEAIYLGVNAIYNVVKETYGPAGSNMLLPSAWNRGPRITNDGYMGVGCITPKNVHMRAAADIFREASTKTNEKVGDATTLTTILGGYLYNQIYKFISEQQSSVDVGNSINVMEIKKEILESAEKIKAEILKKAIKIETLEDLEKIAIISVEDEKLGKIIAKMAWEVGVDGFIDTVEGYKGEIETEIIKGMRFPAKIAAKGFLNNPDKYEMVAQDCPVLITNYVIDNTRQIKEALAVILKKNPKLIIIAPSFSSDVLEDLWKLCNKMTQAGAVYKSGIDIFPVKVPSLRTEQFEDLSIYCGANFINKDIGNKLENANLESVGFLEKLIVKDSEAKEDATAIGGESNKAFVEGRIKTLKGQLAETRQESFKKLLERRIASMASAVGVIKVGGSASAEVLYKKHKIEDAIYSCKAALRKGYIKGGGLCLREIADTLDEKDILYKTILEPYELIKTSGITKIGKDVIDPAEAIYYALEYATQVVANLITVESITQEIEEMNHGEGHMAIARQLREKNFMEKKKDGILTDNENEIWKDAKGGLTDDEFVFLNEDK